MNDEKPSEDKPSETSEIMTLQDIEVRKQVISDLYYANFGIPIFQDSDRKTEVTEYRSPGSDTTTIRQQERTKKVLRAILLPTKTRGEFVILGDDGSGFIVKVFDSYSEGNKDPFLPGTEIRIEEPSHVNDTLIKQISRLSYFQSYKAAYDNPDLLYKKEQEAIEHATELSKKRQENNAKSLKASNGTWTQFLRSDSNHTST